MNAQKADVIIVGGGIMGAATAFFLRRRGVSVILLEMGLIGQQASGVNFGNVRRQGRYIHFERILRQRVSKAPGAGADQDDGGRVTVSTTIPGWTDEPD